MSPASASEALASHLGSPEPYPIGWFQVLWSDELRRGQTRSVRLAGRDLVLFRDDGGVAHLLDGTCPHLGASLAHGGRVVGGRLECPLHGWRFDGEGRCRAAPGAAKLPNARVLAWDVREANQAILAWHHPQRAAPSFEPPTLALDAYRPLRRLEQVGRGSVLDVWENFFDTAHFVQLHRYTALPAVEVAWEGPRARLSHQARTRFLGRSVATRLDGVLHGPGVAVLRLQTLADLVLVVAATPIDATTLCHRISLHVRRRALGLDRLVEEIALHYVRQDARRDLAIWSHKRFLVRPMLSDADGPIHRFRRWYTQFCSPPVRPVACPSRSTEGQST